LTAVRNILFVDNIAMGTYSCIFMAALNGIILLADTCRS